MTDAADVNWSDLRTVGEAIDLINSLFDVQVENAEGETINTAIPGDAQARDAFLTLLPPEEQRALFLARVGNRRFWPRIRSLVGAPPYTFLRDEDEGVLRAAGVASHRTNMSNQATEITPYNGFGAGHFSDASERLFKVIQRSSQNSSMFDRQQRRDALLPWVGLRTGERLVVDARVKKRSKATKIAIARGSHGSIRIESIQLPRPGDEILLGAAVSLIRSSENAIRPSRQDGDGGAVLRVRVTSSVQRAFLSPVARLVAKVL